MKKNVLIAIYSVLIISSQLLIAECPPSGTGSWSGGMVGIEVKDPVGGIFGEYATVNYEYRNSGTTGGNQLQFKIDWSTLTNGISGLIKENSVKKMLIYNILKQMVPQNGQPYSVYYYFQSNCYSQSEVTFDLSTSSALDCCDADFSNPESAITEVINGVTHRVISINKKLICGTKCCARVYTCEWNYDSVYNHYTFSITSEVTQQISQGCESVTTYLDCNGNPLPCDDGGCINPDIEF